MDNYNPVDFSLKSLEDIFKPLEFLGFGNSPSLENYHKFISNHKLHQNAPIKVQELFETAKNLQLYSLYVYRFGIVSAQQAITAMELALREFACSEGYKNIKGLRNLLEKAHKENWVDLDKISPTKSAENFISSVSALRNDFAHGSNMLLDPLYFLPMLESTSQIINALYAPSSPEND